MKILFLPFVSLKNLEMTNMYALGFTIIAFCTMFVLTLDLLMRSQDKAVKVLSTVCLVLLVAVPVYNTIVFFNVISFVGKMFVFLILNS